MAKLRMRQKAHRALDLLIGLGARRARVALQGYGFTDDDVEEGWRRLQALTMLMPITATAPSLQLVEELDAWENRWFPLAELVLRTNYPSVHAVVFANLRQTEGIEVIAILTALLDRLERVARPVSEGGLGDDGRAARALLAKRGLGEETMAEARELLGRVGVAPETQTEDEVDDLDRDARRAAEQHLWSWYLEWSGIAPDGDHGSAAAALARVSAIRQGERPRGGVIARGRTCRRTPRVSGGGR